ncbi:hypothetical protein Tco_1138792, partial [Tanacetum coccineum]
RQYSTSVTKTKAATYEIKWIEDMVPNLWSPVKVVYDKHAYWVLHTGVSNVNDSTDLQATWSQRRMSTLEKESLHYTGLKKVISHDFAYKDIDDILLLPVQQKLTNLMIDERYDLNVALQNALDMFSIRIHHGEILHKYPGRRYVNGHVDIFNMVDIDLFTVTALNKMVLQLCYTGPCLGFCTPAKDSVCDFITPRSMPHDMLTPPIDHYFSAINLSFILVEPTANPVIDDVMRQLSFDEIKLEGEADFGDVTGSSIDIFGLSHDEYFGVDDLDLNLILDLNVPQIETQKKVLVFEVPMSEVPNDRVVNESDTHIDVELAVDVAVVHGSGEEAIEQGNSEEVVEQGSEEVVEETSENEIVEPDVDVHLFGIGNDVPFNNIGLTSLVPDDVLEGEDIDVVNADGFDSDTCYDDETSTYMRRRLNELRKDMEEALNASGCWKHSFYTRQKFSSSKEAKDRVYLHSNESKRKLKLYKNKNTRVRARCEGELRVFTMSQGSGPTHPNQAMSDGPSGSSDPTIRSKKGRV